MAYRVTLVPGDGTGPEVIEQARRILEATGVSFEWDVQQIGASVQEVCGGPLPPAVLESIRRNGVALKGPVTTPIGSGFRSVNVALRKELNLYVNLRPARRYQGVKSPFQDVDLVIVRENTEDLYAGIEFDRGKENTRKLLEFLKGEGYSLSGDTAVSLKVISWEGSTRIVRYAFEYAGRHGRKKVTAVHKANIMKFTDGLFLEAAREVAKEFPEIEYEERIVDNMCMQLVQKPEIYDVLVMPNLYGDIISDLCAGLVGGLGVAPSANLGDQCAVFEPVHGSAPKYAGQNKVNPIATILSGALLLRHLGEERAAVRIEEAVGRVITEGKVVTYDMKKDDEGSAAGTKEVGDAILVALKGGGSSEGLAVGTRSSERSGSSVRSRRVQRMR